MKRRRVESTFLTELAHSAKAVGAWWYKIPDTRGQRFVLPKPFDALLAYKNRVVAIEAKAHTRPGVWPLSTVEAHQLDNLEAVANEGNCVALVVLLVRYGRGAGRTDFAFLIPPAAIRMAQAKGIKSWAQTDLFQFTGLRRSKEGAWNIEPVVHYRPRKGRGW